jgi:hypothetical protein
MSNALKMHEDDTIQPRKVGDEVPEISTIDPGMSQYHFGDLSKAVEFAKLMCQAGVMLPKHAQNNPAICLALTMRATHWGFDPFALSQETFQAKEGGPVGYQAKVFTAVARKAGIILQYRYEGDLTITDKPALSAKGNTVARRKAVGNIKCIAYAHDGGKLLEFETPELDQITIKNSALWHNDPKSQLAYYAGRGWMRRYRSDLMMGAYSDDEVKDMPMRDVSPAQDDQSGGFAKMIKDAREADKASPASDEEQGEAVDGFSEEVDDEPEGDPDHPAYQNGLKAAEGGLLRGDNPYRDDPDQAFQWFAGFDTVEQPDDQLQDDGGEA